MDRKLVADVALDRYDIDASRLEFRGPGLGFCFVAIIRGDLVAERCKPCDDRRADAASAAGNQRYS